MCFCLAQRGRAIEFFLVFPELILGEYKGLGIKKNTVTVSDIEIKKVLDNVLKSRTVFSEVKRPAQKGDR